LRSLPTTTPRCLLRLPSSHPTPGRPSRLPLLHRRSPCPPAFAAGLPIAPAEHVLCYLRANCRAAHRACIRCRAAYRACRTRFVLSSRQLQSCPSRLHSPPGCLSRLPIAPFNCSIPDCEDSSIRVIKRYAAGFSFATIAHRRERLALPNLHLHSPAAQLLQLLRLLNQPLNQT